MASPSHRRRSSAYEDFTVRIGPDDGQGYRLSVGSPAGESTGVLRFPFSAEELARLAASENTWKPRSKAATTAAGELSRSELRRLGRQLFEALFQGDMRDLYYASRGQAAAEGRGLRLRLQLDPGIPELSRIIALPWELLRPANGEFLALEAETPIVRHPFVARPAGDRPALSRFRVLVVMAQPEDQPRLELQREWQALETIWRPHPTVELVPLENPTLENVLEALEDRELHVLHLIGHGGFDTDQQAWALCFRGEGGRTDYVRADRLAEQLADSRRSLRLVVLNACQTARVSSPSPDGLSPGTGVAMAMVSAGITAVVAMQALITDRAAIELSKGLYHRLAAGDPVERALTAARKRIRHHEWTGAVKPAEWATPVLFLRSAEGELFDVPHEDARQAEPASWKPSPKGLAALAAGALGLAPLAGLSSLWLWDSPPLRSSAAVAVVVLGGLGWLGRRLWARHESRELTGDFSRWIAARRGLLAVLFALPLAAAGSWARYGPPRLDELRCAPLGPLPPGVRRVELLPWKTLDGSTRQESLWAGEVTDRLTDALSSLESLQVLTWPAVRPEKLDPECVGSTITGHVRNGEDVYLRATLARETVIEASGSPDDFGEIDHLQNDLIVDLVEALGIDPTPEQRRRLERPPTTNPRAMRLNRLGVAAFLAGDLYEAQSKFLGALALDERYSSAHNNLGRVLMRKTPPDYAAAVLRFSQATLIEPRHSTYHFNLGLALERHATANDAEGASLAGVEPLLRQAADAYRRAIELNRANARAYNNLGFTLLELEETAQARESLVRGRNLASDNGLLPYFEKNLGRVFLKEDKPRRAADHLERAVRLRPDFPEALYYLALAQERSASPTEACETLKRYAEVADRDPEISRRQDARQRLGTMPCGG